MNDAPDGAWVPFTTVPIGDIDATGMIDFSADGKTLYVLDSRGRDKAALVAIDMATRQAAVLASDDEADIVEVMFTDDRRPLAARATKIARAGMPSIPAPNRIWSVSPPITPAISMS